MLMQRFLNLKKIKQQHWMLIYLLIALLIACKVMYNQHGWVNTDSLLYFEQARLIASGQFKQALALYGWPFYSALIALVHTMTTLDIHTAAQVLNAMFYVLFVAAFQQLLLGADAQPRTFHWGHLLLFSTPYMVGDVLGMLLRDEGFWAAYTWALVFWTRFARGGTFASALAFQISMLIAVLFRIEAVAYLVVLPFLVMFQSNKSTRQRWRLWMTSNALLIMGVLGLMFALMTGKIEVNQLGRLKEIVSHLQYLFTEIASVIQHKSQVMGKEILGGYLDDYARFSVISSLLLIVAFKTIKVAGYPVLLSLLVPNHRWWSKLAPEYRQLAICILIVSFMVSIVIILNVFVLSSRYVIASGIIMLLLASLALSHTQRIWRQWSIYCIWGILGLMLANNLWDHSRPDLDRLAVNYIEKVNLHRLPVFYDTENARFYAKQPYLKRINGYKRFTQTLEKQEISNYAYFMISVSQDEEDLNYATLANQTLIQQHYQLVHTLYGWHHKTKALIYVKQPTT